MFGKKKTPPASDPPNPPSRSGGGDGGGDKPPLPWAGWPDDIGCNFAGAHLVANLHVPLQVNGRVQAETLMTAAGALAGWGAQRSLIGDPSALAAAERQDQLLVMTLKDGRRMLFGDALNAMLVDGDPAGAPRRVWNWLRGAAMHHGLPQAELPDVRPMFSHVSKELGGPREGFPSTPAPYQPFASAQQILEQVLPLASGCLTGEIDSITKKHRFRAEVSSYQAVTAWAAGGILSRCCAAMPPRIALRIGMEAAIYASKLMPPPPPRQI